MNGKHGGEDSTRVKYGNMETWKHGNMEMETWKHGNMETWKHGNMETWKQRGRFSLFDKIGLR